MKMLHEWLSKWKQLCEGRKELSGRWLCLWNQDSHSKWNNPAELEGLVSSLRSLGHVVGFAFPDFLYPDLVNLILSLTYSLSEALIHSSEIMPTLILPCPLWAAIITAADNLFYVVDVSFWASTTTFTNILTTLSELHLHARTHCQSETPEVSSDFHQKFKRTGYN